MAGLSGCLAFVLRKHLASRFQNIVRCYWTRQKTEELTLVIPCPLAGIAENQNRHRGNARMQLSYKCRSSDSRHMMS